MGSYKKEAMVFDAGLDTAIDGQTFIISKKGQSYSLRIALSKDRATDIDIGNYNEKYTPEEEITDMAVDLSIAIIEVLRQRAEIKRQESNFNVLSETLIELVSSGYITDEQLVQICNTKRQEISKRTGNDSSSTVKQ